MGGDVEDGQMGCLTPFLIIKRDGWFISVGLQRWAEGV